MIAGFIVWNLTQPAGQGRLLYPAWWLDDGYSYNKMPFQPRQMSPDELQQQCVAARREDAVADALEEAGFYAACDVAEDA